MGKLDVKRKREEYVHAKLRKWENVTSKVRIWLRVAPMLSSVTLAWPHHRDVQRYRQYIYESVNKK